MFIHTAYDKPYMLILSLRILCAKFLHGYLFFANAGMGQVLHFKGQSYFSNSRPWGGNSQP